MSKQHSTEKTPILGGNQQQGSSSTSNRTIEQNNHHHHHHDIHMVAIFSRPGPSMENNYMATPHNSKIYFHGDASLRPQLQKTTENLRSICFKVVDKQRVDLNQFNDSSLANSIFKTTFQIASQQVHVLEHHFNGRFYFYVCLAEESTQLRICFGLLDRVKNDFIKLLQSINYEIFKSNNERLQEDCYRKVEKLLSQQLDYCTRVENDKIVLIQSQIEDVKKIMVSNIDKIIVNMESTRDLTQKSNDLNNDSQTFIYQAKNTNNRMICRVVTIISVLICILVSILIFIILMIKYA